MYKYFSDEELKCKCGCNESKMDDEFMQKLIRIREDCGFPFSLSSAYRCPEHNNAVSSTGLTGPHTTGHAVDIKANSRQRYKVMEAARKVGFTRFGIAKSFIHIDDLTVSDGFDEEVIWTY